MRLSHRHTLCHVLTAASMLASSVAFADVGCGPPLPTYAQLKAALDAAVAAEGSGLNFNMWGSVVNRDGLVCAVAFSGSERGAQWPGSRVISAQKANTANAFSLDNFVLSTANLYSPVQPGQSLFGLQESNPVNPAVAYAGNADLFGTALDPMVGKRAGGVNVFGGGLGLYTAGGVIVGGVGVSGDTSCADHNIGWRVRNNLGLDHLANVGGVSGDPSRPDNIIYLGTGEAPNGFKHPTCVNTDTNVGALPATQP